VAVENLLIHRMKLLPAAAAETDGNALMIHLLPKATRAMMMEFHLVEFMQTGAFQMASRR
jgi:hypothetical protein